LVPPRELGGAKMLSLLYKPEEAILDARRKRSIGCTLLVLLVVAVLWGIVALVVAGKVRGGVGTMIAALVGAAIGVYVMSLFLGLLTMLAARTIGGRGGYFAGLTAYVYSLAIITVGVIVAAILGLIPKIGVILAAIILPIATILSCAAYLRGVKELFSTDTITAFVTSIVVYFASFMGIYAVVVAMMGLRMVTSMMRMGMGLG